VDRSEGRAVRTSRLESLAVHTVLLVAVAVALYPVLWVVALALSGGAVPEARAVPLPIDPTLEHVHAVVTHARSTPEGDVWLFGRQFLNSIVVAGATAVVGVAIAIPAAYALARMQFVGKTAGVRTLLATQMFPTVASAIPLYLVLDALGLLNSRTGLVLCYASTAVPFAVFQLRAAFEAIPVDLEEAAMVDGATRRQAFVRVVLPVARPAIAVTALFAFMSAYNEFILAATFLDDERMFTLPVMLQRYIGEYDAQWELFAAGAIIVSLPVMLLFYVVQRHIVAGLAAGGVKG
jgi:arabinogalactan oligomer / maltooligosaccharide transport system permease protein